jgi:hypothetical protein
MIISGEVDQNSVISVDVMDGELVF